jgi:hypothetical protein
MPIPKLLSVLPCAVLLMALPTAVHAAPGLGDEVYGATVTKGETEIEARYGALRGGSDQGGDALKLEVANAPLRNFRIGALVALERDPGGRRIAKEVAVEAIYALGRVGGIDVAVYGEYAVGLHGEHDALETKLLLQRRAGPFDARLNLIAGKSLASGERVEFEYAASADIAVKGEVRAGLAAFGELGTARDFLPRAEHFVGPVLKGEIEGIGPEIGIEAGYLFALGKARDTASGQFRLTLEVEF